MNVIDMIAQRLYDGGVRLEDNNELLAMAKADKELRYAIVSEYRKLCDEDVEVTINMQNLPDYQHNLWELVYETIYEDLKDHYAEVDAALWRLQNGSAEDHKDEVIINRAKAMEGL